MNTNSKQHGFTLIELMVTIAILAIMVAIALPNMSEFLNTRRVANRADQVANLFRFARAEAVRTNRPVIVCSVTIKANSGEPNNQCNASMQGLTAFHDADDDGAPDAGEAIRTVAINQNSDNSNVLLRIQSVDFAGQVATLSAVRPRVGFFPDGTFGIYGDDGSLTRSSSFVRYTLSDNTDDMEARARRTSVVLLDASGRAMVCPRSNASNACTSNTARP